MTTFNTSAAKKRVCVQFILKLYRVEGPIELHLCHRFHNHLLNTVLDRWSSHRLRCLKNVILLKLPLASDRRNAEIFSILQGRFLETQQSQLIVVLQQCLMPGGLEVGLLLRILPIGHKQFGLIDGDHLVLRLWLCFCLNILKIMTVSR